VVGGGVSGANWRKGGGLGFKMEAEQAKLLLKLSRSLAKC